MGASSSSGNVKPVPYTDSTTVTTTTQQWPSRRINSANVIQEFMQLDERICKLESTCPGPRTATCRAWLEHLQSYRDTSWESNDSKTIPVDYPNHHPSQKPDDDATTQIGEHLNDVLLQNTNTMNANVSPEPNTREHQVIPPPPPEWIGKQFPFTENGLKILTRDLVHLALSLGAVSDPQRASKHEDFFAQLNETSMDMLAMKCYGDIMSHASERLRFLHTTYLDLTQLYSKYDSLLALITEGSYLSLMEERLDTQLVEARLMRDRLGATLEQWRICGLLLRASSSAANQGLRQWRKVKTIVNPKLKLETTLLCRKDFQDSLSSFEYAQASLPQVDMKYVSRRQMSTVKHCCIYIITDLSHKIRCEHTTRVFKAYAANTVKAASWFYDVFRETLRQDFDRANDNVFNLSETLREHRKTLFRATRNK